ncbi:aconitase family protein [Bradyrhizobium sp. ORS 111]|uniref:aconitase family protein n=1 Tax=Bradyrhizobium sp. ORS 111 TaxID=1685958 RepID=UPI00388DA1FE
MSHSHTPADNLICITGRVLFLAEDPALVLAQLRGQSLSITTAGKLRDNVSTDEITPVTVMFSFDERLGRYPYVGFETRGEYPIGVDDVRRGGFAVTVAGKRYGKGSSRESSPLAELHAGIRLIIAESFERIYQQNCDNVGILTSTNFSLIDRIEAGQPIPIQEFLERRDDLTCRVVRAGGLLPYARSQVWTTPVVQCGDTSVVLPRTLIEKILARRLHPETRHFEPGTGIFVSADWRFSHDYFTGMAAHFMHKEFGEPAALFEPDRVVAFHDHLVLAQQSIPHQRDGLLDDVAELEEGHHRFTRQYPVRSHGALQDGTGSEGICHAIMAERYALPGQVIVGTDSHTPHCGALGCLAFGVGATDMANSWVTGYVRCKVPETLRIEINGLLPRGVTAKDIVLHLLRRPDIRAGMGIGCVFEYCGSTVQSMPVDERATLTNMVAELGGFTGIVAPDEQTVAFLHERRDIEFRIEPWMTSDPNARYRATIRVEAEALSPMVASPGDPGNGIAITQLTAPVKIDIAYGGSCTAGKRSDFDAYYEVLRWGIDHSLRVAAETKLFLQFGTLDVYQYCADRGFLDTFRQVGAVLLMPGCGACANCGPGQSENAGQVTISATNRNFAGRSGPGQVWLASPYTVAASALQGTISTFADF